MKKVKDVLIVAITNMTSWCLGYYFGKKKLDEKVEEKQEQLSKQSEFYSMLIAWLEIKQGNRNLKEYFDKRNYKKIAIYGMKELGERLYAEFEDTGIDVVYTIDKSMAEIYKNTKYKTVYPSKNMEKVDVIVVTATHYFATIYAELSNYTDAEIVSLEDVIYEIV